MKKLAALTLISMVSFPLFAQDIATIEDDNVITEVVDSITDSGIHDVVVVEKTVKFGYLSYTKVIEQMDEYNDAMMTIAQLRKAYDNELRRGEENFSKLFAEYVEGQQSFPENILLKRQKELQQAMDQSIQFKNEAKALLEKKEKDVMDVLHNRLKAALASLAKERHYAFIINTDGDTYPFVNPEIGDDVTDIAIQMLKSETHVNE